MSALKVGFIGLGDMGMAMARCLPSRGFSVTVFDLNKEAMEKMVKLGAKPGGSCSETAKASDVIISMVSDIPQTEEVIFGKAGVWEGIREDSIIIISSTVSPGYVKELSQKVRDKGVHVIDAGVSDPTGPVHYREAGLTLMIGGDKEPVKRCWPVFEAMGEHIFHLGPVGTGMAYKLVNNLSTINCSAVTKECLNLGLKAGLDLQKMIEVMSVSTGGTCLLQNQAYMQKNKIKMPSRPAHKNNKSSKMTNKDKSFALSLGDSVGAQTPISRFLDELDQSVYDAYVAALNNH